jgi:hypothetical protein
MAASAEDLLPRMLPAGQEPFEWQTKGMENLSAFFADPSLSQGIVNIPPRGGKTVVMSACCILPDAPKVTMVASPLAQPHVQNKAAVLQAISQMGRAADFCLLDISPNKYNAKSSMASPWMSSRSSPGNHILVCS